VVAQDGQPKVGKPVPVVQPKEEKILAVPEQKGSVPVVPEQKVDTPPTSDEGTLPWSHVKNRLVTMPVGTKAYISAEGIKCDSKRKVYLEPDLLYGTRNEDRTVMISRDATGYHISLGSVDHQWMCQELPPGKWMPVKTISVR